MKLVNNIMGAFADGAVLFPLLITLSMQNGMNLSYLLLSAGLAYVVSGYVFRIPMSVQPLKSIAIAGLAVGASSFEIRAAALLLGLVFISSLFFDLESLAQKIPERLIHGIQIGLGVVLIQQGFKYIVPSGTVFIALSIVISVMMIFITYKYHYPILGFVASIGFFISLLFLSPNSLTSETPSFEWATFRPLLVLSLVLPQIALTSANSVLATVNVAQKYFGSRAEKVSVRKLVYLIGFGNVISALLGGLPFCHGSGGLTAHYKGGARTNLANYIIGFALVLAAVATFVFGGFKIVFAPLLLSILLITVGIMHALLAKPSWSQGGAVQLQLILMALAALISGNMLWVLGVGLAFEIINRGLGSIRRKKAV